MMTRKKSVSFRYVAILLLGSIIIVVLTLGVYFTSPSSHVHHIRSVPDLTTTSTSHRDVVVRKSTVVFVVRAHAGYASELMSFLWMMRCQTLDQSSTIAILVVPTEYNATSVLKQAVRDHWSVNIKVVVDVLELPMSFYEAHCCHLTALCTATWRTEKLAGGWPSSALDRYCSINTPLHYHITDAALRHALSWCRECIGIVITNADNFYAPTYVSETLNLLHLGADMVLANMVHRGEPVEVKPESGSMDLGAVMFSCSYLRASNVNFASSLPRPTEPQHWHDADYWLVERLLNKGARLEYIRTYLFTHN